MLKHLALLSGWFGPLRVFDSITFRAAVGLGLAFVICVGWGGAFIAWMRRLAAMEDVSKPDSRELERLHSGKKGTPTMGGLLILLAMLISLCLVGNLSEPLVLLGGGVLLAFGLLGLGDDYYKLRGWGKQGLTKRQKLIVQIGLAVVAAAILGAIHRTDITTRLLVPFTRWSTFQPDLGWFYYAYFVFVVVAATNAVNFTDGLDGLAGGCSIMVAFCYAIFAYVAGNAVLCDFFRIPHLAGAGELAVLATIMVGALMGFVWFNAHPAQVFMGDTGSLALGALIAYLALAVKQELVLVVVGGIYVIEGLSVVLQILSYRYRGGKRIFKCAPFHHHLEFSGWHENQVVVRLWLVGAFLAAAGLVTLKMH